MFLLASAVATTINLVCPGVWTGTTSSSDLVWSSEGGGYVNAWVDHATAFEGEVRVEIEGDAGRLLDSGRKKSKWRPLSKVRFEGGRIQARLPSVLWAHPSVTIDLSAGRLRVNDVGGSFFGVCRTGGSGDPPETGSQ